MGARESGKVLGVPLRLPGGSTLPNRLVKAATSELLADARNRATPQHATLYGIWARGGPGLLLTGNVQIVTGTWNTRGTSCSRASRTWSASHSSAPGRVPPKATVLGFGCSFRTPVARRTPGSIRTRWPRPPCR